MRSLKSRLVAVASAALAVVAVPSFALAQATPAVTIPDGFKPDKLLTSLLAELGPYFAVIVAAMAVLGLTMMVIRGIRSKARPA